LIAAAGAAGIGLLVGFGLGLTLINPGADAAENAQNLLHPWVTLFGGIIQTGVLAALTYLFFLPFILNYKLAYTSFIPWTGSHTPLWAYLDILGLFLFLIISWMVAETIAWFSDLEDAGRINIRRLAPWLVIGVGALALVTLAASAQYEVAAVGLPLMVWAVALFLRPNMPIEKRAILAILTLALLLSMMVEVIVLQGDLSRMNTVFKFYVQVWILMGITAAAAFGWLWPALSRALTLPRQVWGAALAVLVFLAALYPLLATRAKMEDRWAPAAPHTLDGMAYMAFAQDYDQNVSFSLKPDYDALRWMQDNIQGTPVVLEAHTTEYLWGNRVTVYTGLPAIVGWNWHQRQQRPDQSDEVFNRVAVVDSIYNTVDENVAMQLMQRYHVRLIMLGDLERAYYNSAGLAKFVSMADEGKLTILYNHENTVIYEVTDANP